MGENTITVGGYPCIIEDGATDNSIMCTTTTIDGYYDYNNLPISMTVATQGTVTTTQTFSYKVSATPYLNFVYPSVSYGGS